MVLRVCVAGATGWTGAAVTRAILESKDFVLSGAVSRSAKGRDIGEVLGGRKTGITVSGSVEEALTAKTDVLVDYTSSNIVKTHVTLALERGISVVVGTSGLTESDYEEIGRIANNNNTGVIAAGNFCITAALVKHFSLIAAQYLPQWEILDFAHAEKVDTPSGTVRELAEALGKVKKSRLGLDIEKLNGPKETRGAEIGGARVHSIRLPGYVIAFESIFGLPDERLIIRHEAGPNPGPYVEGTLLAIGRVKNIKGIVRGLDTLLFHS
jgi:4-hydroxy-tetrahydrodipicolinate reductase